VARQRLIAVDHLPPAHCTTRRGGVLRASSSGGRVISIFDVFSSSGGKKAAEAANTARVGGLNRGFDKAAGFLDQGLGDARTTYERAASPFAGFIESGNQANAAYGDAIGLNGPEGNDRAVEAFRAGPGYNFQVDQANEAIKRNAAATGMLGSGNTLIGISDRTRSMADTEYQGYLDNLFRGTGQGLQAASGQAGVLGQLAGAELGTGQNKANFGWQQETGIGQSQAQLAQDRHAAEQGASANIWNSVFNVGRLAAGFMGGSALGGRAGGGDVGLGTWDPINYSA